MKITTLKEKYIEQVTDKITDIFVSQGIDLYGIKPVPKELIRQKITELTKHISRKMDDGDWASSGNIMVMKEVGEPIGFAILFRFTPSDFTSSQLNGEKTHE